MRGCVRLATLDPREALPASLLPQQHGQKTAGADGLRAFQDGEVGGDWLSVCVHCPNASLPALLAAAPRGEHSDADYSERLRAAVIKIANDNFSKHDRQWALERNELLRGAAGRGGEVPLAERVAATLAAANGLSPSPPRSSDEDDDDYSYGGGWRRDHSWQEEDRRVTQEIVCRALNNAAEWAQHWQRVLAGERPSARATVRSLLGAAAAAGEDVVMQLSAA